MRKALGAHIYAGGFTVGISKYFDVIAHFEHAAYGKDAVELNFPDLPVIAGGPAAWRNFKLPTGRDRIRFVYANPPCACWSTASHGRSYGWEDDPRLAMHHDVFGLLPEIEPDVFAFESVPPYFTKGRSHVDSLIEKAKALGYSATIVKHDSQHHGVPQSRRRVFLVFHRVAIDWEIPEFDRTVTVREALKRVGKRKTRGYSTAITEKHRYLLPHTNPGESLAKVFDRLFPSAPQNERSQIAGRPSFLDVRFPLDRPGPIVIAGKPIHPTEERYLSQEELAEICSFPPDFKWPSGKGFADITGYMSRGVMPKVGEWLAENVARAIETGKRLNRETAEVLDINTGPGYLYDLTPVVHQVELPWAEDDSGPAALPALAAPAVVTDPVPRPRAGTAVVDWSPRLCGSTAWGGHFRAADPDGIELLSFSKSGNTLQSWESAFEWSPRRIADAADILNDYDRVVLCDIACFTPKVPIGDDGRPYYLSVLEKVTRRWTAVFHGGTYPTKHDATIDAVFSSPGFARTLLTPRLGQATRRLAQWPDLKFVHLPHYAYDPAQSPPRRDAKGRTRGAIMTARVTSNKGQNAAMAMLDRLAGDVDVWGYSAYGFPSSAYSIWELGVGLGYGQVTKPMLPPGKEHATNPDVTKFTTGFYDLRAANGSHYRYHGAYRTLDEIDWSPWLYINLASPDFADILEYTILDAVFAGAIVAVPENFLGEVDYKTVVTFPFEGSTICWDAVKGVIREGKTFDRDAVAAVINRYLKMPTKRLAEIADAQLVEFTKLHDPAATLAAIDGIFTGGRPMPKTVTTAKSTVPPPAKGQNLSAYVLTLVAAGIGDRDVQAAVHEHFPPVSVSAGRPAPVIPPPKPMRASKTPLPPPAAVPARPNGAQRSLGFVPPSGARPAKGSGARIRELLLRGFMTPKILELIHVEFPGSKAGPSDVSWNKQKLRKDADAAGLPRPL
jgi:site-specific DNA-cytosine methylase